MSRERECLTAASNASLGLLPLPSRALGMSLCFDVYARYIS